MYNKLYGAKLHDLLHEFPVILYDHWFYDFIAIIFDCIVIISGFS